MQCPKGIEKDYFTSRVCTSPWEPKDFTRYIICGIDFIDGGCRDAGDMIKLATLSHSGNILQPPCELRTEISIPWDP